MDYKKNDEEKKKLKQSFVIPITFVFALWFIKSAEIVFNFSLITQSVFPRSIEHLYGILLLPLIHSDTEHLVSNTIPLLLFGTGLIYFYQKSAKGVLINLYFIPGIFVWLFGRASFHVGASTIIYGMAAFLFFSGVIRRDKRAIVLALLVTFIYGGMVWGILPIKQGISWEGHLFGAITGLALAILYRKSDPYKRYDWEEEEEDETTPPDKLEISYKKGYPFE